MWDLVLERCATPLCAVNMIAALAAPECGFRCGELGRKLDLRLAPACKLYIATRRIADAPHAPTVTTWPAALRLPMPRTPG